MTDSSPGVPAIEFRWLCKSFGANEVLKGIDLAVAPKQVVGIGIDGKLNG